MIYLYLVSGIIWACLISLPFKPWATRELFSPVTAPKSTDLDDLTVLIPARDEERHIKKTLLSLQAQGSIKKIIVVNDESSDNTEDEILTLGLENLTLVNGDTPPSGWTGKLWALHQGLESVCTPYLLLLDADITLEPKIIPSLLAELKTKNCALVSIMAVLRTDSFWERLLIPSFIYFFKLLYPFALSNKKESRVAAAAGGLILIRTNSLREIGGFETLKDAIIDDCALAKLVKQNSGQTWIGLCRGVQTTRSYDSIRNIWNMVARTAYTQLRYSLLLLFTSTLALIITFMVPAVGLGSGDFPTIAVCVCALSAMVLSYYPIISFYRMPIWWCLTLPLSATLFLLMTWTSAFRYWAGQKSHWKNRTYLK